MSREKAKLLALCSLCKEEFCVNCSEAAHPYEYRSTECELDAQKEDGE